MTYQGFEQGPIRPPSEASSMLFRLTRNCSWNRCTFCPVYKGEKFSVRPVEDVLRDIDAVHAVIRQMGDLGGCSIKSLISNLSSADRKLYTAASNWYVCGCKSIFLQDGDSLAMKPDDLLRILRHIKQCFPSVERITSYARSNTIVRISDDHLRKMADAGLNRIHVGLETASDKILRMVKKGATKESHINAGLKVKQAGIELSEYVLTGIGGDEFSKEHAIETSDALNQINPDFIRFRTLHIPETLTLFETDESVCYQRPTDLVIAKEVKLLIENLDGVTSKIRSDHMLNLFQEVNGDMPRDKSLLVELLQCFLDMTPAQQMYFQVGKRLGHFHRLQEVLQADRLNEMEAFCRRHGLTPDNVDDKINEMIQEQMRAGVRF